ncbi:head-tail connector protein [Nitratireductor aquimarinus]|uniref:head-tail connector protein n=1 Tax=Nitratireductor aquimarinus TaxID=889300 RepID=UPI00398F715C
MSIVSLALGKAHLNIFEFFDDEIIQFYLDAAEHWLGGYIGKPLSDYSPDWIARSEDDGTPIPPPADYNPMPADLKLAVLKLASFYYEQREAVSLETTMRVAPFGVTSIADCYREKWFGDAGVEDGE